MTAVLPIVFHVCLWFGVLLDAAGIACLTQREWKAARWCSASAVLVAGVGRAVGSMYAMAAIQTELPTDEKAHELAMRIDSTMKWTWVTSGTILAALAVVAVAWIAPKLLEPNHDATR